MKRFALFLIVSVFVTVYVSGPAMALTDAQKAFYAANDILYYDDSDVVVGGGASGGCGFGSPDSSVDIAVARNAELSFFNGSPSELSARWGDTDESSMARLIDNYGELACLMGRKYGVPWIAVLVQMRYEDPDSVCGANNFWGNGCPPGTGAGGASIQGANLGEGFDQYGRTLNNGAHNQAIGISDPKLYLEKIGPTWVQGSINGPGYGQIGAMKVSVDRLAAYISANPPAFLGSELGGSIAEVASQMANAGGNYCWGGGHGSTVDLDNRKNEQWRNLGGQNLGKESGCGGGNYGLDCSGFARSVIYFATGTDIGGHVASNFGNARYFDLVDTADVQPGDFLYTSDHVQIVVEVLGGGSYRVAQSGGNSPSGGFGFGTRNSSYNSGNFRFSRYKGV